MIPRISFISRRLALAGSVFVLTVSLSPAGESAAAPEVFPAAQGMKGKVFVGYQGWYRTPTDGSGLGWEHFEDPFENFEPGNVGIEYWPDVSELGDATLYETPFRHKDGSVAKVFSSEDPVVVDRHVQWMKDYDINGLFLQRFVIDVVGFHHQSELLLPSNNRVLENVQQAANRHQRAFSLMYDLSGLPKGEMGRVIQDWKNLNDQYDFLHDPAYLRNDEGKPVVAVWGVGFNDGRKYTLEEVSELVAFLHEDPEYGGCSVILGVPTHWREQGRDTIKDPALHDLLREVDVVMPWYVGRFGGSETARKNEQTLYGPDQAWCHENGLEYLPVIFPGFSWANRYAHRKEVFNKIPREGGKFLWAQAAAAVRGGANMIYVAMFDEMDEGTQIFKVTDDVPVGESKFLSYAPESSDFYLRLVREIHRMVRGEIPSSPEMPSVP